MKRKSFIKRLFGVFAAAAVPLKATQVNPPTKWWFLHVDTYSVPDLKWEWAKPFGWDSKSMCASIPMTQAETDVLFKMFPNGPLPRKNAFLAFGEWLDKINFEGSSVGNNSYATRIDVFETHHTGQNKYNVTPFHKA